MEIFIAALLVFFTLNFLGKKLLQIIKKNAAPKRHPYFLKDDIDYTYKPKCKCKDQGKKKNYTYPDFVKEHYKPEITDGKRKKKTTDKN